MEAAESSGMGQSVLDLHTRDVETYQYEPLTWNTVVADSSSHDSATTENDGEGEILGEMHGKRLSGCLHFTFSDWIANANLFLLNWSATALWLL